jgi:hypothetical protein
LCSSAEAEPAEALIRKQTSTTAGAKVMSPTIRVMDYLPPPGGPVSPGDTVYLGPHTGPIFRVLAIVENRAWGRDEQRGIEHIVSVHRCYPAFAD